MIVTQPEKIILETETCGYCGKPLVGYARIEGHKSCIRKGREMDALKMAEKGVGQINEREEFLRHHPDGPFVGPGGLTYNQRLAKQETERGEAQRQTEIERAEKIRRKKFLEGQLRVLNLQIKNDANTIFGQKGGK